MFNTKSELLPDDIELPAFIDNSRSGICANFGNIWRANSLSDMLRSSNGVNCTLTAILCRPRSPIFTVDATTSGNSDNASSICLAISWDFSNVDPIGARAVIFISSISDAGENSFPTKRISIDDATNITNAPSTTRPG